MQALKEALSRRTLALLLPNEASSTGLDAF